MKLKKTHYLTLLISLFLLIFLLFLFPLGVLQAAHDNSNSQLGNPELPAIIQENLQPIAFSPNITLGLYREWDSLLQIPIWEISTSDLQYLDHFVLVYWNADSGIMEVVEFWRGNQLIRRLTYNTDGMVEEEENFEYNPDHITHLDYYYNENNQLIHSREQNDSGTQTMHYWRYDQTGRLNQWQSVQNHALSEQIIFDSEGQLQNHYSYQYRNGQIQSIEIFNGNEASYQRLLYDEAGNLQDEEIRYNQSWESTEILNNVIKTAESLSGAHSRLNINGQIYRNDCSGFITGLFDSQGINLLKDQSLVEDSIEGGLASVIYLICQRNGWIHQDNPLPGDLVFFDNTYDRNRNGAQDDSLTHIGIVQSIDPDGTVWFYHNLNRRVGVVLHRMHLADKDSPDHNDYIGVWSGKSLSGQLFAGYATLNIESLKE